MKIPAKFKDSGLKYFIENYKNKPIFEEHFLFVFNKLIEDIDRLEMSINSTERQIDDLREEILELKK